MNIEEYWEAYTASEKELFQRACRRLLKSTFIVRDKDEEHKRAYHFIARQPDPFLLYFRYIGFEIAVDRENGVIMLCNSKEAGEGGKIQSNRFALKKVESIVLCCLWTLYADRVISGSLSRTFLVSVADLRFELEKYELKEQIDKSTMQQILTLFAKFNLVDLHGKVGEEDCTIRLYPSLQFALDPEEFDRFVRAAGRRMFEDTAADDGEDDGPEKDHTGENDSEEDDSDEDGSEEDDLGEDYLEENSMEEDEEADEQDDGDE